MSSLRHRVSRIAKRLQRGYAVYNRIEVSRAALLHNARYFKQATGLQVIPVLKGNAYGHGIEQVATALRNEPFPCIAVDGYFEALKVHATSRRPVLVMGMIRPENIRSLHLRHLAFLVHDEATIRAFGDLNKPVTIHLEINTGMNRNGIATNELTHYLELVKSHPKLRLQGVMAHLADPDGDSSQHIDEAVARFDAAVEQIFAYGFKPTIIHTAQSGGGLRANSRHATAMRLGIGLYGINPYPSGHKLYQKMRQDLRPALKLVSIISRINQLQAGDKVSYNYTFTAPETMRVGVLQLGYHEGVNRALSNVGVVKLGGHFLSIVGRVCMNHTIISLEGTKAQVGDEVMVYSDDPQDQNSIDNVARTHQLFSYNLLTDLSPDVRRRLVD